MRDPVYIKMDLHGAPKSGKTRALTAIRAALEKEFEIVTQDVREYRPVDIIDASVRLK